MATEKTPAEQVMEAFNEFKASNDANLKQRDVVLEDKINKINDALDKFEPLNQKLTLATEKQAAMQDQLDRVEAALNRNGLPGLTGTQADKEAAEYRNAFEHILRNSPDQRDPKMVADFNRIHNTLIKTVDTGAGFLLAPPEIIKSILKDVLEISPIRQLATVRNIGGDSLKQPKRTNPAGAAARIGETAQRTNTGDPAYGMLEWKAPELYARAEISQQMLEDADYDLIAEINGEFAEQFALKEGTEFTVGTGTSNQAEGLLTNSSVGYVATGDAALITADGLINLYYSLKTAYTSNARFLMNRTTIRDIRKLKDTTNQYLWQPGLATLSPNTILGASYVEVPDMPAIAANAYPVLWGDIRKAYIIVDRIGLSMQTDFITMADYGTVVFRARKRVGGGVREPYALKKLKVAVS